MGIETLLTSSLCCFQFALMETVTTAILDKFPNLRQYKTWVVFSVAIVGYIGGLGFTTRVIIHLRSMNSIEIHVT